MDVFHNPNALHPLDPEFPSWGGASPRYRRGNWRHRAGLETYRVPYVYSDAFS